MNREAIGVITDVVVEYVTLFPAVLAVAWVVLGLLYSLLREWRLPDDPGFTPTVAAVIAAHDEEVLIGATIEALLAQDYPALQIHVVSDGSTDRTAEIAARYRDRDGHPVVVHELVRNVGKSAALQSVLDRVDTELFLVVDADTISHPGAVRAMVQQFADPSVGAVTGHARVANVVNPLTAVQAMEYAVIVGLAKRAEQFWGGLYTVSGAAACLRTRALHEVGGWTVATATEDIEVSWRLQRAGWRLGYEPRAVFAVQAPTRLGPLIRQRRRWARGMVEVMRLHAGFASAPNRALVPIAAQVFGAAVWMLLATAVLLTSLAGALLDPVGGAASISTSISAAVAGTDWARMLLWSLGLFAVQTVVATGFDAAYVRGGWRLVPLCLTFPLYFWVVIYPSFVAGAWQALCRPRRTTWSRTERTERADGHTTAR